MNPKTIIEESIRFVLTLAVVLIMLIVLALAGCAAPDRRPPAGISHVLDVYVEDDGFFVISERGTGESLAVRFNVHETHPRNPRTQETKP